MVLAVDAADLFSSPADGRGRFENTIGLEITELTDEVARGHLAFREELRQPFGLLHGGVFASMAESLASWATAQAVAGDGKTAMGLSNQTSFLRPVSAGTVHGVATRKHRGRTTWIWEVEMSDEQGRLCALTRVTVAVREG